MISLLYQIPTWIQRLYADVVWRGDLHKKCVYLTFDDGPVPEVTPQVLDILEHYGVRATFFCVGENVYRYGDLAREVVRRGHSIGNHTFNHLSGCKHKRDEYLNNIALCEDVLSRTLGSDWTSEHLFRPPYGRMRWQQRRWLKSHYRIVLWDIITHDYNANYSPQQILAIVRRYVRCGSVIVFHDSIKAQRNVLSALPLAIEYLQSEGYQFEVIRP